MQKLIIFLIRKHFGLKKYEDFRFTNQKSKDTYYFSSFGLMKLEYIKDKAVGYTESAVSLNWLLNPECKVKKLSE